MIDFSGAFLTAEMDKEVIVISENEMFDAMLEIDKEIYRKYVIHRKKRKKQRYVCLSKTMYRTIKAALLYYRKLSKEQERKRVRHKHI